MDWILIGLAAAVMLALAIAGAYVLGRASRAWEVHEDPLIEKIEQCLAGLDCGQCGYPTCNRYAEAIVKEDDDIDKCRPGGAEAIHAVATVLGVEAPEVGSYFAVVHCGATQDDRLGQAEYHGEPTCAAADVLGGVQGCAFGCLGLGDCVRSCPFDAIHIVDGLAVVDYTRCTACGNCVRACPRDIVSIEHFLTERMLVVACNNTDPGRNTRAVCKVGCIACGICARECELFDVRGDLTRLDHDRYHPDEYGEGLRTASRKCPTGCLPFRGLPERQAPPANETTPKETP
ncbi:MAG: RnfABCDGE type electron transport complex subunit B [Phycisphaerae bacterium]